MKNIRDIDYHEHHHKLQTYRLVVGREDQVLLIMSHPLSIATKTVLPPDLKGKEYGNSFNLILHHLWEKSIPTKVTIVV